MTSPSFQSDTVGEDSPIPVSPPAVVTSEALVILDILRGMAILGGLFVSIWIFGGFSANQQNGLLVLAKGINYRAWGAVELLLDGKMRTLICLVFGAGMILFLTKTAGDKKPGVGDLFIRRQLWLMAFGILNAIVFLWQGDLLFTLGMVGIFLFPFARLGFKGLLIAAFIATFLLSAKTYWNHAEDREAYSKYQAITKKEKQWAKDSLAAAQKKGFIADSKKDSLSAQEKEDKAAWEGIAGAIKYDPKKKEEGFKEMRDGSYGKEWNYVLPFSQAKEAQWSYRTGLWDLSGMILLGMALFKLGFFGDSFKKKKLYLLALAGLGAGLLLGWFRLQYNQYALNDYAVYVAAQWLPYKLFFPFEKAFLAVGYAALSILLIRAHVFNFLWKALALVGRMALSNYLLQTMMCVLLFNGFGMGYFGRLPQYQLYLVVVEMSVVQIAFSAIWLKFYRYGPAEWLLRSLLSKKWLPIKINPNRQEVTTPHLA